MINIWVEKAFYYFKRTLIQYSHQEEHYLQQLHEIELKMHIFIRVTKKGLSMN